MRLSTLALPLTLALAVPAMAEDLTIVTKYSKGDGAPTTGTSYFTSGKMRASHGTGDEVIADYATGTMTMIDGAKKEYFVITTQDIEAMSAQMEAQKKEMEAKTQNLPPEYREKMAAMMGGMVENVDVHKGTGGRTIAGYACQNWIVTMGKMMKQDTCVSTEVAMPVGSFDAMKRFASSMGTAGPMGKSMSAMWEKFKEMKGFPLATKVTMSIMGRETTSSSEVTEIRKGAVPASVFEIPAGYKKVDSPVAKMGQGAKRK